MVQTGIRSGPDPYLTQRHFHSTETQGARSDGGVSWDPGARTPGAEVSGHQNLESSVAFQLSALISWERAAPLRRILISTVGFVFQTNTDGLQVEQTWPHAPNTFTTRPSLRGFSFYPLGKDLGLWDVRNQGFPGKPKISKLSSDCGILVSKSSRRGCPGMSGEQAQSGPSGGSFVPLKFSSPGRLPGGGGVEPGADPPEGKQPDGSQAPLGWDPSLQRAGRLLFQDLAGILSGNAKKNDFFHLIICQTVLPRNLEV